MILIWTDLKHWLLLFEIKFILNCIFDFIYQRLFLLDVINTIQYSIDCGVSKEIWWINHFFHFYKIILFFYETSNPIILMIIIYLSLFDIKSAILKVNYHHFLKLMFFHQSNLMLSPTVSGLATILSLSSFLCPK